jgi:hypothetical protein
MGGGQRGFCRDGGFRMNPFGRFVRTLQKSQLTCDDFPWDVHQLTMCKT